MNKALAIVLVTTTGCATVNAMLGNSPKQERAPMVITAEGIPKQGFPDAEALYKNQVVEWGKTHSMDVQRSYTSQTDWQMQRHPQTGTLTGRSVNGVIFARNTVNNACYVVTCRLYEPEVGGGKWGNPSASCDATVDNTYKVTCDSVATLPQKR